METDARLENARVEDDVFSCVLGHGFLNLTGGFDVGVNAHDHGVTVDDCFGGFVAVAAGDRERLAGGRRTWRMQRDFDVEDVVLDGGFHGWL